MGRIIRVGTNMDGQVLDASTLPDGHARQSYFGGEPGRLMSMRGATIRGDIQGSDLLWVDLRDGADLSQAETYGCLFTGSLVDATTVLPPDPGPFQRELTYEMVRRYIPHLPTKLRPIAKDMLIALRDGDNATFCQLGQAVMQKARDADAALGMLDTLPPKVRRFIKRTLETVAETLCGSPPSTTIVTWPDGVTVTLDRDNLPPLPRPDDRYELARWIEREAGPPTLGPEETWGRYCFVTSIRPWPRVQILPHPDAWLETRHGGL